MGYQERNNLFGENKGIESATKTLSSKAIIYGALVVAMVLGLMQFKSLFVMISGLIK